MSYGGISGPANGLSDSSVKTAGLPTAGLPPVSLPCEINNYTYMNDRLHIIISNMDDVMCRLGVTVQRVADGPGVVEKSLVGQISQFRELNKRLDGNLQYLEEQVRVLCSVTDSSSY